MSPEVDEFIKFDCRPPRADTPDWITEYLNYQYGESCEVDSFEPRP